MNNAFVAALDTITESFATAHQVHGGEPIAIEYARTRAGGAIADLLAEKLKHETTVRMVIKPDVNDTVINEVANELGADSTLVRDILVAVLAHQLPGINQIRKTTSDDR